MLVIREDDVRQVLTMETCIEAVQSSYEEVANGSGRNTPRQNLWVDPPKSIKLASGGLTAKGFMGVTSYTGGYGQRGSGPSSTLLYDARSGSLVAFVESRFLGWYRTGATSAVAARVLAPKDSRRVGIIGTGRQARSQLLALSKVLPLESAVAFSRNRRKREEFAAEMSRELGTDVKAVESAKQCVSCSDVVVTITTSNQPVLERGWLGNGVLVNALGSHHPTASEVDAETVLSSRVIVDSREQALLEKGEILIPIAKGLATPAVIKGELGDVIAGRVEARQSEDERVLFCSGGTALEQVGVAAAVYDEAVKGGLGVEVV